MSDLVTGNPMVVKMIVGFNRSVFSAQTKPVVVSCVKCAFLRHPCTHSKCDHG